MSRLNGVTDMNEVLAINLGRMEAYLASDEIIPIVKLFENDDVLVSAVAGPDKNGKWHSIDLSHYSGDLQ